MNNPTIKSMFERMNELDAGYLALVNSRKNGEAVVAAVFLQGDGTQEILDAIEEIYDRQDRQAFERNK